MESISYSQEEVPYSVQVVLKRIESAQLRRAKQEMAEKLQVILNRMNRAFFHVRLGSAIENKEELNDDEVKPSVREERKKCRHMLSTFLQSRPDKENDISMVLQWLNDVSQELQGIQDDEEFKFADNITKEWVMEMEVKIQMFICDMKACIERLQQLSALLFDLDSKTTKKKKEVISKDGVWRWWREPKADAKTIRKIQALQPSSVDCILSEISLGNKTVSDLSFMLVDMAKSLSCSKTMGLAFKFAQSGLQNLNDAFQEQSCQVQHLQALLEQLKAEDWQAALKHTKAEFEDCKKRLSKLEGENCMLREEKVAFQLYINQLQEINSKLLEQQTALTAPVDKVPVVIQSHQVQAKKPKATRYHFPPRKPHKIIEASQIMEMEQHPNVPAIPQLKPDLKPDPLEPEVDYFEGVTYDSVASSTSQTSSDDESCSTPILEHPAMTEKKRSNLLEDFHSYVLNITETYLSKIPRHNENDISEELQDIDLNADIANDPGKLYTILLNIINDSFKNLDIKRLSYDPEVILEKTTLSNEVDQGKFPDNTIQAAVNIPTYIKKTFSKHKQETTKMDHDEQVLVDHNLARKKDESKKYPKHRQDIAKTGHNLKTLKVDKESQKKDESRQDSFLTITDQLSNANSKELDCRELLIHECFQEIPSQPKTNQTELTEEKSHDSFQEELSYSSTPSSESMHKDGSEISKPFQTWQKSTKSTIFKRRVTRCVKLEDSTQKHKRTLETQLLSENMKHFKKEMEREGNKIAKDLLKGVRYQMNHETKRTNILLLQNAMRNGKISVQLYNLVKDLMENIQSANLKCLAFLLRKYMASRALWQVRDQLNLKLCSAREQKDGLALKEYYNILTKLDRYEGLVLGRWRTRQTAEERRYRASLGKIIYVINQLREDYNLGLLNPYPCKSYLLGHHFLAFEPREVQRPMIHQQWRRSMKTPNHLTPKNNITLLPGTSTVLSKSVMSTPWKRPATVSGVQLTRKASVTSSPAPIIPRLLEMNIRFNNTSALKALQDRTGGDTEVLGRSIRNGQA